MQGVKNNQYLTNPWKFTVLDTDIKYDPTKQYGPPQDTVAWACRCGCFGFYIRPDATMVCWDCQTEQVF